MNAEARDEPPRPVEPDRPYTPDRLAAAVGLSERSIRDLYRSGELRCRRIGPLRGRVVILGRWWLDYERRGEQGPEAGKAPRPRATQTPASSRRVNVSAADVAAELERSLGAR